MICSTTCGVGRLALIGDRRIEPRKVDRPHRLGAEHERIIAFAFRIDAGLDREHADLVEARGRIAGDAAFEQARRRQVLRHLQRAPDRQRAGRAAVVVVRRPVVGVACIAVDAADRRIGDRRVFDQRVGLQAAVERGEIGHRLERRARLPSRLRDAVELAHRIGEPADHRQHAAGLVLQHQGRALHRRSHAKLDAGAALLLLPVRAFPDRAFEDFDVDDVVLVDPARGCGRRTSTAAARGHPSGRHGSSCAALIGPPLDHDRRRPVHVVERQPHLLERNEPGRLAAVGLADPLRSCGSRRSGWPRARGIRCGRCSARIAQVPPATPPRRHVAAPAGWSSVSRRTATSASRRRRAPAPRARSRRPDGSRCRGEPARRRTKFSRSASASVACVAVIEAVVLHPGQHIGETLMRPVAIAVRIVIGRSLGQAGDERAFGQRQVLHRLAEIRARREVDAPRRAAEIDRVEIDFENLRLGQRLLDAAWRRSPRGSCARR